MDNIEGYNKFINCKWSDGKYCNNKSFWHLLLSDFHNIDSYQLGHYNHCLECKKYKQKLENNMKCDRFDYHNRNNYKSFKINIDDREKLILPYIEDKNILDVGCADIRSGRFLHKFLNENSKSVIGLDINLKKATPLIKEGYNIIIGNAENKLLHKKFDIIIAGDLIEHLNNPGCFLQNMKKHLKKDGKIIINTPNIYSVNLLIRGIITFGNIKQFYEHSCGFDGQLISELISRYGLKVEKIIYYNYNEGNIKNKILQLLSMFVPKWKENIFVVVVK